MNSFKISIFLLTFLLIDHVNAQIQWASELVGFSSELQKDLASAKQVLGPPNVLPESAAFSPCAWTTSAPDRESMEYIDVAFAIPQHISSVIVSENINPGSIVEIQAFDTLNRKFVLYQKAAKAIYPKNKGGRLFVHSFNRTFYKVRRLKLVLFTEAVPGFNQIDAIGISADTGNFKIEINELKDAGSVSEPENLGPMVNDDIAQELAPVISADGKTLYFTRQFHSENIGDSTKQDVWYSEKSETGFLFSKNIGSPVNNATHNALIAALPDGNSILLLNKYLPDDKFSEGISMSFKNSDGWSFPSSVEIDSFYNLTNTAEYALASDGKTLLMTIQRDDAIGNKDIYVSFKRDDGKWSVPKNLGRDVNTAEVELAPFLASDTKTLFFASKGYPGYGGTDMYMSRRLDDTWTKWSVPQNLGSRLNSTGFDAYYTIPASGDFAYFSSSKDGKSSDIYRVKLPESAKPNPVQIISGKVFNAKTKEPMGASIFYESLNSGKELGQARSNPVSGDFRIVLPSGDKYGFLAEENGFLSVSQNIDLTKISQYGERTMDLYLYPLETGASVQLNNLFFETSKFDLKPEDSLELNRVYKLMIQNSRLTVEISGHTDNVGNDQSNLTLSNNRAMAVTDYLVSKGIEPKRLKSVGYGKTKPLSTNLTEDGRAKNRRIELKILSI
jgi:OOP family OmpA-OmpF porin